MDIAIATICFQLLFIRAVGELVINTEYIHR